MVVRFEMSELRKIAYKTIRWPEQRVIIWAQDRQIFGLDLISLITFRRTINGEVENALSSIPKRQNS